MNKSRKLKKAERALAKAEKAAVRAAQVVAKANKKRERILARERLRHDAEVARKAKKRAAKQGSAKQESAKQGSAKQAVQRAAESAERVVEDAIDKVADTAFGLATTPRTLTPVERTTATTTTTTTKTTTTVAELRELAKAQGIAGYSKLTKAELLSALDKG